MPISRSCRLQEQSERTENWHRPPNWCHRWRKPRNSNNEGFQGKLFVQFVALGYYCFFKKKIKDLIESLELPAPTDSKCDIVLKEKLLAWLKKTSITDIFEWFSAEQTKTIKTQAAEYRFSTERTKRDQLFFQLLGISY